jgi:hypothetical protein
VQQKHKTLRVRTNFIYRTQNFTMILLQIPLCNQANATTKFESILLILSILLIFTPFYTPEHAHTHPGKTREKKTYIYKQREGEREKNKELIGVSPLFRIKPRT